MQIRPVPTEDEAAAIAAAVDLAMNSIVPQAVKPTVSPEWRFRSRWWNSDRAKGR